MTGAPVAVAAPPPDPAPASAAPGSPWRSVLSSGWIPAGLALAASASALKFYGVPLDVTALFLAYLALAITLPGMLVWRFAHHGAQSMVLDIAAGTAVGYAIEVLAYIIGRAVDVPLLVVVPPIVILLAFAALPQLRQYWRGAGTAERAPALWSWTMAGFWMLILFWSFRYMRYHGLGWPSYRSPDTDMPFHLSLLGEAKHHFPLMTPWVSDEPVLYHWFVYAEMAATSWVTGIEPMLLLTRLSLLPMVAAFMLIIAMITRRLTGRWWAAAVAVAITFFVLAPDPYGWHPLEFFSDFGFSPIDDGSSFRLTLWTSPTQTFGALMFAPAVALLMNLFMGQARNLRKWFLFAGLLIAVMGGKATFLPLLLAGLVVIIAGHLLARRRFHQPVLVAGGITFVYLLFAQFVLFGGASQGLKLEPLGIMKVSAAGWSTGFTFDPKPWRLIALAVLTVFSWICIWAGVVGLRRRSFEPQVLLLLGLGIAGMGAILTLGHTGGSQGFFLQSARPYLAIAAACGLAALVPKLTWRLGLALGGMAVAGMLIVRVMRFVSGPERPGGYPKYLALGLVWPYAALFFITLAVIFVLWRLRRRIAVPTATALVVCMVAGFGLMSTYSQLAKLYRDSNEKGWREVVGESRLVTHGTMEAGRWLRDHSRPSDLVATNAHCMEGWDVPADTCVNLHFAISAYTERHVLVEGWGFTATAHVEAARLGLPVGYVPYWRPQVLADNDAAFERPSALTVHRLRDVYKVRWMFVDLTQGRPPAELEDYATPRYRAGDCVVYEINP